MDETALAEVYSAPVDALSRFRDAHLRIVALYIVQLVRGLWHSDAPLPLHPLRLTFLPPPPTLLLLPKCARAS